MQNIQLAIPRDKGIDVRDGGVYGDGQSKNFSKAQSLIDRAESGATLIFPPSAKPYLIDGTLTVWKPLTIEFAGATLQETISNTTLFSVTSGGVTFRSAKSGLLKGPQHLIQQPNETAISVTGTVGSYIDGFELTGALLSEWGMYGVYLSFVKNFSITRSRLSNLYYTGVGTISCTQGDVSHNTVDTVIGTPNAYGVFFSRNQTSSLVTDPRSTDITCIGNIVKNVVNWEGLDTHGGQGITFTANRVSGCTFGIAVGCSADSNGKSFAAPLDCDVIGNTIDSGVTDGSAQYGIPFTGATGTLGNPVELATGTIVGNTIRGHGNQSNGIAGAIYMHDTKGVAVVGNTVIEPSPHGLYLGNDNYDYVVTGNTVRDQWSTSFGFPAAIQCDVDFESGVITSNRQSVGTKVASHLRVFGIRIGAGLNNSAVSVGPNSMTGATTPISVANAGAISTGLTHTSPLTLGVSGVPIAQHLSTTAAWTPPSVAVGAQVTTSVAVTGAALGDTVVVSFNQHLQGMHLSGYVASSSSINVVLYNGSAVGPITLPAGTLRVDVWQH